MKRVSSIALMLIAVHSHVAGKGISISVTNDYFDPSISIEVGIRAWGCVGVQNKYKLVCNRTVTIPHGKTVSISATQLGRPTKKDKLQVFVKTDERGIYYTPEPVKNGQHLVFRGTLGAQGTDDYQEKFNDFIYYDGKVIGIENPLPLPPH